jgi:S-methylmethionine-dependent homocysteine/selenocysteine methylase
VLAFETVPCRAEVQAIMALLNEEDQGEGAGMPAWISLACRDSHHLNRSVLPHTHAHGR